MDDYLLKVTLINFCNFKDSDTDSTIENSIKLFSMLSCII